MLELAQTVRQLGTVEQQATLIHVATNSIQYHLVEEPDGGQSLQQLPCTDCLVPLTLSHLTVCPGRDADRWRQKLAAGILSLAEPAMADSGQVPAAIRRDLMDLLLWIFPPVSTLSPEQRSLHGVLCSVGAFPSSQLRPSLRSLSRAPVPGHASILQRLRLLCIQRVQDAYSAWKERF